MNYCMYLATYNRRSMYETCYNVNITEITVESITKVFVLMAVEWLIE